MRDGTVSDSWNQGDPYEQYVGRWSRLVASRFLSWLRVPEGLRWLDVGCGTGALTEAILDEVSPSSVIGVEPSEGFRDTARKRLAGRAVLHRGSATEIPLDDGTVDAVVSGLVLNFVPEPDRAVAEMARVAVRGGTVAAYVWDYADGMEMMRLFWDAATEVDSEAARLDEGVRFPLCNPDALAGLYRRADLRDVAVDAIEIPTEFASFDEYWQPFLGGQGPAPAYAMSLDPERRDELRERLRAKVPARADGAISLTARAWAVRGGIA